ISSFIANPRISIDVTTMERRAFIKNLSLATAAPIVLGGLPINLLASNGRLQAAAGTSENNKVLILIQMHGGNDGLNTIIPINQYNEYYNLRPNIAIPDAGARKYITLDTTLAENMQTGLHPDMLGVKQLYDQGKVSIVQGVSYPFNNQSHFRSRDLWFMGADGKANLFPGSGWAGRMLDSEYANYPASYPNTAMPDPLALEIGTNVSLLYHRSNGIPVAISISNPEQFYNLIQTVGNSALPEALENTYYGTELKWIMEIEKKSDPYAAQLKAVFDKGSNSAVTYPSLYTLNAPSKFLKNNLAPQLKLVARLLAGGIKTKVFVVRIGGFDTHANQVENYNSTYGNHAALLYHISSAMKAFQDDLKELGQEDRVMTATVSEFGRRPQSNGSYGSDHGSAAPMLLFGKYVKPGVIGTNPDLSNLSNGNLPMQNDYRSVLRTVLEDWLQASPEAVAATGFDKFAKLDVVSSSATATKFDFQSTRFAIGACTPNPATTETSFSLKINDKSKVFVQLYNTEGKLLSVVVDDEFEAGTHQINVPLENLSSGIYTLKIDAGIAKGVSKVNVIK
ncbi:MAG: DUF1501 domain-containing protein, partial [Cytophagales bacterium]